MKTAIKTMTLLVILCLTSCTADPLEDIKVDTITHTTDPGDEDDVDCKSNECS